MSRSPSCSAPVGQEPAFRWPLRVLEIAPRGAASLAQHLPVTAYVACGTQGGADRWASPRGLAHVGQMLYAPEDLLTGPLGCWRDGTVRLPAPCRPVILVVDGFAPATARRWVWRQPRVGASSPAPDLIAEWIVHRPTAETFRRPPWMLATGALRGDLYAADLVLRRTTLRDDRLAWVVLKSRLPRLATSMSCTPDAVAASLGLGLATAGAPPD